ncbi:RNA methyltransferase [Litorimonas cladophorae]|uniref:RNA methyltransferase n=1 Tax=Litorimonas cladophorae TaxID=1220491 RepID=A0A918KED8_9PROT|nr:RNA methyltransferase [Litorimonas cladophorae]GGX60025.1 RNA methyltransferase [Litorimonas cladophorae]
MGKAIKDQLGRVIEREDAPQPAVILVRPQLGENIGAACRGMLNFGLTELRLVAPRDGWPNPAADAMAAGAVELIENAKLFDTVEAAVADLSYVLAATARRRELEIPVVGTTVVGREMRSKVEQGVGILFGPEKAGLTNADVVLADAILTYPVNPAFQSLNLAQAVNVFAFIWAQSEFMSDAVKPDMGAGVPDYFEGVRSDVAPREDLTRLFNHMEEELDNAGFFFPAAKKHLMLQNIRAPLTRAQMSEQEVRTFRGIIKALAKGRGNARGG